MMRPCSLRPHQRAQRGPRAGERPPRLTSSARRQSSSLSRRVKPLTAIAGVVDQDVDAALAGRDLLERAIDRGAVRDVEAQGHRRPAGRRHQLHGLDGRRLVGRVVDHHPRARARPAPTAMARPMPREPPVTTATLPSSSRVMLPRSSFVPRPIRGSPTEVTFMVGAIRLTRPASTAPAPSSSASVTPSASSFCIDSSQRTGAVTCSTSSARSRSGSWQAAASTLVTTGTLGRCEGSLPSSAASRSAAGRMSAQWKGALTASGTARLAPRSLQDLHRPIDGRLGARDDHLAAAVEVGRRDHRARLLGHRPAALGHRLGSRPRIAAMRPCPAGTASCMNVAAQVHQADGVGQRQRARRHQRGVLAQRVAGDEVGAQARAGLEHAQGGHAGGQDGRLGVGGQGQLGLGPLEAEPRQRTAPGPRRPPRTPRGPRGGRRPAPGPCRPSASPGPETGTRASAGYHLTRPSPRPARRPAP